jgi:hypothetical protein
VTVHNGGQTASVALRLTLQGPNELTIRMGKPTAEPLQSEGCPEIGTCRWFQVINAVPPGQSVRGTFIIGLPADLASPTLAVQVVGYDARMDRQPNANAANQTTLTL